VTVRKGSGAKWIKPISALLQPFKSASQPCRALTVLDSSALPDLDNITVRIADVAANLAVLGNRLWLRESEHQPRLIGYPMRVQLRHLIERLLVSRRCFLQPIEVLQGLGVPDENGGRNREQTERFSIVRLMEIGERPVCPSF
jgi:hypothetical protein